MNQKQKTHTLPAWVEIDLNAIRSNFEQIRQLSSRNTFELSTRSETKTIHTAPMGILAVVKANAYGHGVSALAPMLDEMGLEFFGVSDVAEGMALRKMGIKKPILLFESSLFEQIPDIVAHDLMPSIGNFEFALKVEREAQKQKKSVKAHVEVDTGMGRLGVWQDHAFEFIQELNKLRSIVVEGIYTHFPAADTDPKFTQRQIQIIHDLVLELDKTGMIIPFVHASNSMGLIGYQTSVFNVARPGLMLYGLYPYPSDQETIVLQPAMSVKSKVIHVQRLELGRSVSYGRTFIANKDMSVATIPVGYHDGYLRGLSNKAQVLIQGTRCPILGTVTMDQIVVDVSSLKEAMVGEEVVLLGQQKDEAITPEELAQHAGTINYEIVCSLGNLLPHVYTK